MFLAVLWAATAAVLGFMAGRVSMYSMYGWKEELAEGGQDAGAGGDAAVVRMPEAGGFGRMVMKRQNREGQSEEPGSKSWRRQPEDAEAFRKNAGRVAEGAQSSAARDRRVWPAVRPWEPGRARLHKRGGRKSEEGGKTWSVGSPVSGEFFLRQDEEQIRVVIRPDQDRLYAPADGKIIRLFPMGNAFLFKTEFGLELYIQVGEADDELLCRYFRPRVIRNEVVPKGKLLLEFDRQGLWAEGASAEVSLRVDSCFYGSDVRAAGAEWVLTGEEILRVSAAPEKCLAKQ